MTSKGFLKLQENWIIWSGKKNMVAKKYKFRQVGVKRHPELYTKELMTEPVFDTVEKELEMWKVAEDINKIFQKHVFTTPQRLFIWHFVNTLSKMDSVEELGWLEWLRFRLTMARILDVEGFE